MAVTRALRMPEHVDFTINIYLWHWAQEPCFLFPQQTLMTQKVHEQITVKTRESTAPSLCPMSSTHFMDNFLFGTYEALTCPLQRISLLQRHLNQNNYYLHYELEPNFLYIWPLVWQWRQPLTHSIGM